MIDGVRITHLKQIVDERGRVMHMLRRDDAVFQGFGEIYFSCVYPGVVKAWRCHMRTVLNYAVPVGHIKFVLYDDRPESKTRGKIQEIILGPDNYCLVTVPTLIWNGFSGIGTETAVVANCATEPHDPADIERLDSGTDRIPYHW